MNWSDYLPPLHPEGRKFVLPLGAVTVLMLFVAWPLVVTGLVLTLACAYFFRDPARYVPDTKGILVSPADGRIQNIVAAPPPPELAMGDQPVTRISIFLSVVDVHVARAPAAASVEKSVYVPGRFLNASLDKASTDNERQLLRLRTEDGHDVAVALIAGLVARRIVCPLEGGETLARGQRVGIIRFGSRADVYLDPALTPAVAVGQVVLGGETVLAVAAPGAQAPSAVRL